MEIKKVKAEIVEVASDKSNQDPNLFGKFWFKIKLGIAVILDGIDFLIGWIPLVNTAWDIISFIILLIILKNKRNAFIALVELPLLGIPPFSIIDMFLPICTFIVIMDGNTASLRVRL